MKVGDLTTKMPISSKGFARTSLALIIIGLLALIGIVGTTIWLVERTQVYFEEVVEAREGRQAAVELRNLLQDAQSGQRGFLLTQDEVYLEPYEAAIDSIEAAFQRLDRVLEPYPQAEEPMAQLRNDIDTKLSELASTIALASDGNVGEAIAIVRTDTGETVMARIRQLLDAIIEAADTRTFNGVIEQRGAANALRIVAG